MFRTMLKLCSITVIVLGLVCQPGLARAREADQASRVETTYESPQPQGTPETTHVQLVLDSITCNRQTYGDRGGQWIGENDHDEVYLLVSEGSNLGSSYGVRLPGEDDYISLTTAKVNPRGHTWSNTMLWEGDLREGETAVVHVIVREQDNEELGAVLNFFKDAGPALVSLASSLFGGSEVDTSDLVQLTLAVKDAVQELSQDGHDTIGHFVALITNRGAEIQIAYVDPRVPINQYQGIGNNRFKLNGDGSRYDLKVSWQGLSGKKVSALTALSPGPTPAPPSPRGLWVGVAGQSAFPTSEWATWWTYEGMKVLAGDFNGDGKTDVMKFDVVGSSPNSSGLWVGLSDGTKFNTTQWAAWQTYEGMKVLAGDFNGDGKTDVMKFDVVGSNPNSSGLWVGLSDGTKFNTTQWATWQSYEGMKVLAGDFNGDGKTDVMKFDVPIP